MRIQQLPDASPPKLLIIEGYRAVFINPLQDRDLRLRDVRGQTVRKLLA
jgi:hypothetical protein